MRGVKPAQLPQYCNTASRGWAAGLADSSRSSAMLVSITTAAKGCAESVSSGQATVVECLQKRDDQKPSGTRLAPPSICTSLLALQAKRLALRDGAALAGRVGVHRQSAATRRRWPFRARWGGLRRGWRSRRARQARWRGRFAGLACGGGRGRLGAGVFLRGCGHQRCAGVRTFAQPRRAIGMGVCVAARQARGQRPGHFVGREQVAFEVAAAPRRCGSGAAYTS